jgi:hypothetical protein
VKWGDKWGGVFVPRELRKKCVNLGPPWPRRRHTAIGRFGAIAKHIIPMLFWDIVPVRGSPWDEVPKPNLLYSFYEIQSFVPLRFDNYFIYKSGRVFFWS